MKRNWWLILIIVMALAVTFPYVFKKRSPQVIIGNRTYGVELAQTEEQMQKGLSGRDHLDINAGMLFVFPASDIYPFWMKDTLIPLDIIYINNNIIVDIATLQPQNSSDIPQYTPTQKANFVLELNANSGFKVGDEVNIKY